jgi:23S rRNA (adenine2503-C2)-methyltransferase
VADVKNKKRDLLGMLPGEIDEVMAERGVEPYRSIQVVEWLYQHNARSIGQMTNLPKHLREELAGEFDITDLKPLKIHVSGRGRTKKFLLGLSDGATIEAVLLPAGERSTVCVSSQVGCAFGCVFCASGLGGLARNLSAGEIVDQARTARADPDAGRMTNIVLMGSGEPLANYDETARAVRIFLHERCFGLGKRHVTISTAGYVPGIRKLAEDDLTVRLALSLHTTDDDTRSRLMPINKKYPLVQVLDACRRFRRKHRTPLTIEYMLIEGENDSPAEARRLVKICRSLDAKVNLIAYNPVASGEFAAPPRERILQFQAELRKGGILGFIRRSQGQDIEGACGQLRASGIMCSARADDQAEGMAVRHQLEMRAREL